MTGTSQFSNPLEMVSPFSIEDTNGEAMPAKCPVVPQIGVLSAVRLPCDLSHHFLQDAPDSLRLALVDALLAYVRERSHCEQCYLSAVDRLIQSGSGVSELIALACQVGERS